MSALEFIASLGESFAWPVIALGGLLLVRRPLLEILSSVTSISLKGIKLELNQKLSEAEVRVPHVDLGPESLPVTSIDEDFIRIQPRGAILEQWLEIEELLQHVAESRHIRLDGRKRSGFPLAKALRQSDVLDDDMLFAVERLSLVRNVVVHERRLDSIEEIAERYIDLARNLVVELQPLIHNVEHQSEP